TIAYTLPSDVTPPAQVSQFLVSGCASMACTLAWTAPGNDGMIGTATRYDIRVLPNAAVTTENWASASPVTGIPVPQLAGAAQTMSITNLAASTTYGFGIIA